VDPCFVTGTTRCTLARRGDAVAEALIPPNNFEVSPIPSIIVVVTVIIIALDADIISIHRGFATKALVTFIPARSPLRRSFQRHCQSERERENRREDVTTRGEKKRRRREEKKGMGREKCNGRSEDSIGVSILDVSIHMK
jgi:hypothetical protein